MAKEILPSWFPECNVEHCLDLRKKVKAERARRSFRKNGAEYPVTETVIDCEVYQSSHRVIMGGYVSGENTTHGQASRYIEHLEADCAHYEAKGPDQT